MNPRKPAPKAGGLNRTTLSPQTKKAGNPFGSSGLGIQNPLWPDLGIIARGWIRLRPLFCTDEMDGSYHCILWRGPMTNRAWTQQQTDQ